MALRKTRREVAASVCFSLCLCRCILQDAGQRLQEHLLLLEGQMCAPKLSPLSGRLRSHNASQKHPDCIVMPVIN